MVPEQPELNFDRFYDEGAPSSNSNTPWTVQVRSSTHSSWLCAPIRIKDGEVDEIVVEMFFSEHEAKERAWRWEFELNLNDFGRSIALAGLTEQNRETMLKETIRVHLKAALVAREAACGLDSEGDEVKPQMESADGLDRCRLIDTRDLPWDPDDPRSPFANEDNRHNADLDSDI